MNDFNLTRNLWYAQRDDRTRRVEGIAGFEGYSVGVIVDDRVSSNYNIQVMALTAINILSRWCRRIRVQVTPDATSCLPLTDSERLSSLIEKTVRNSDPFNEFSLGTVSESDFDRILIIGSPKINLKRPQVLITGAGWISGIGVGTKPLEITAYADRNPVGPAFSACLGVAELFRSAIGITITYPHAYWYSLLDFTVLEDESQVANSHPFSNSLDLGRVYQIGCGAVGSCLDYFLSFTNWGGVINLIDYDRVTVDNCNRSLCFNANEALHTIKKTESCSAALSGSRLLPIPFGGDYSEFVSAGHYLKTPPDVILSLANEKNVWEVIQHNYPPMVLHATTSANWTLNFGRHIPKKEWCILCRFSSETRPRFTPVCAQGTLPFAAKGEQPILGVLPFLSSAAADLILSELAKTSFDNFPLNENFVQYSMKLHNSDFLKMSRESTHGCICQHQSVTHYPDEIKSTKLWHLSEKTKSQ
jgi:hypothetical protein